MLIAGDPGEKLVAELSTVSVLDGSKTSASTKFTIMLVDLGLVRVGNFEKQRVLDVVIDHPLLPSS